jgi:hypothetical protein
MLEGSTERERTILLCQGPPFRCTGRGGCPAARPGRLDAVAGNASPRRTRTTHADILHVDLPPDDLELLVVIVVDNGLAEPGRGHARRLAAAIDVDLDLGEVAGSVISDGLASALLRTS